MPAHKIYKFITLSVITLLITSLAVASHIAGGYIGYEFEGYSSGGNAVYKVTMTLLQDCKNGDPKVIQNDNPAHFSIFKKSNSGLIRNITVQASQTDVSIPLGVNPICFDNLPDICLQKAIFTFILELPNQGQADYDPEGYVVSYQRCCRNKILSNVVQPFKVGTTLFTEIPSSTRVINDSPVPPNPPLVICLNTPQRISYGNYDADGDSLDYYLCTSYIGASEDDSNPVQSAPPPYTPLTYRNPFSASSPVPSSTPIYIDPQTGLLEFEPDKAGVYTMVICIDEYRNGVKIAEHHQETQFYISPCSKKSYASLPVLADYPNVHQIVCDGYTIRFGNTSNGASEYYWDFGDPTTTADFSTDRFPTYTYPDTGTYEVRLYTDAQSACPDSIIKQVRVYPYFEAKFFYEGILCPNEPITFTDTSFSSFWPINKRRWDFGDGGFGSDSIETHEYGNSTSDYNVRLIVENQKGCRDTALNIVPILGTRINAGSDTIVIKGLDFQLGGSSDSKVKWTPSTYMDYDTLANPTFNFPEVGIYRYTVENKNELGCIGRDTVTITVTDKDYFFLPNAFTPNGDGLNDFIKITTVGLKKLLGFRIYNRYGELVYSSLNIKQPWDGTYKGKELPVGTYFWVGEGINYQGKDVVNKGDITLIR